jgi:hypothetical protein
MPRSSAAGYFTYEISSAYAGDHARVSECLPARSVPAKAGTGLPVGLHLGEEYQNIDFLSIILSISLPSPF